MTENPSHRWTPWVLGALLLAALALRLHGLEDRVLGHPENYAPGIAAPSWTSYPPPSTELKGVLRGLLVDAHPPLYSLGLFVWTELAGGSLFALRLPSVLLGVLAVALLFRTASGRDGTFVGLAAAVLLALHGHHVFWSQLARMYALLSVTSLLSTAALLRLQSRGRRRDATLYVLATAALFHTHLYAWPLVFAQMLWCFLEAHRGRPWRALRPQAIAILAGLPTFPLLIFQAPSAAWFQVPWEYAELGYLHVSILPFFGKDDPVTHLPHILGIASTLALFCLGASKREESERSTDTGAPRTVATTLLIAATVAMTLALLGIAEVLPRRERVSTAALRACALLPGVLVGTLLAIESWLARRPRNTPPAAPLHPAPLLASIPFLLLLVVSLHRDAVAARGTLAFLPYLLWSVALGLDRLRRSRPALLAASALLITMSLSSLRYFAAGQACPRDYRSARESIVEGWREGDRIFVRNDILQPPLFFDLGERQTDLVHSDWLEVASQADTRRIWVPRLAVQIENEELEAAVDGLELLEVHPHHGIEVSLYAAAPGDSATGPR